MNLKNKLIKTLSHKISVTQSTIVFLNKKETVKSNVKRRLYMDINWLLVGGGGWWWIYFGFWWMVVGGSIVQSNPML